jgi:hypothetical protein
VIGRVAATTAAAAGVLLACSLRPVAEEEPQAANAQVAPAPKAGRAEDGAPTGRRPLKLWFTGGDDGYLDACGCDDGLLGGLPRRSTLLKTLRGGDDEGLMLSNGGLVAGAEPLDVMKFEVIVQAMAQMGYAAIALTERELALGREQIAATALLLGEGGGFIGTNLVDRAEPGAPPLPAQRSITRSVHGEEFLLVSAVSRSRAARYRVADPLLEISEPVTALRAELANHRSARRRIVLAQMEQEEALALASELPELDLIIVPSPADEDMPREEALEVGTTWIVDTGRKGKFLGEFRFGGDHELPEFRRCAVEDKLEKDADLVDLLRKNYREALFALEPKPIERYYARRPTASGASYVGAEEGSCASCHPKAWATWAATKHARAWQTLVDEDLPEEPQPEPGHTKGRQPHAIWDPDCVRCHVTGFGEVSGFAGVARERPEARLIDVGCEACHGPAGDHAQRASQGDPRWPNGPVPKMPSVEAAELCQRCHDPDNSPHFELENYWNGIVRGKPADPIKHGREGD